jgi:antitoxin MazE
MAATTRLSKWGNSLGLRLPKSVAREVRLDEGDTVQVSVDNGTIVIRPSRPRYSLDELVRRITQKNRHDESDWGGPLGDEVRQSGYVPDAGDPVWLTFDPPATSSAGADPL